MSFQIQSFSVADFVEWNKTKRLRLNPEFQRREVWSKPEKTLLIDTILRGYSMPKIYFRTIIDSTTQQMFRDVVDGQQRLKAIIEFSENKLILTNKAGEYSGLTYSELDLESQQNFLQYKIATEQLINASDEAVINIFTRLNQYGVKLNQAELRNAEFDNSFKWFIADKSKEWWKLLLDKGFITIKQRSRMLDDELIAELVQVHARGIQSGDARSLRNLYTSTQFDAEGIKSLKISEKIDDVLRFITNMSERIPNAIRSRPHFVLFYAAVANAMGITVLTEFIDTQHRSDNFRLPSSEEEMDSLAEKLTSISKIITSDEVPTKLWEQFYLASRSAPISLKSRRNRFTTYAILFSEKPHEKFI